MEQQGTTTLTLADALLDDLDDLSGYEEEEQGNNAEIKEEEQQAGDEDSKPSASSCGNINNNTSCNNPSADESSYYTSGQPQQQPQPRQDLLGKRFLNDPGLLNHLKAIEKKNNSSKMASSASSHNNNNNERVYNADEYPLIVACNKHLHTLQDEMNKAHHALMTSYAPKFPELQDLLPNNPIAYKNAVAVIGNEMDLSKINADALLKQFLSSNQIITLSVAGSTTNGRPLTDVEWQQVKDILDYMDQIMDVQQSLSRFVEQRMQGLAPNISALIGSTHIAARLVGLAGGCLAELCRIPACNLQVLGQVKQSASSRAGFSTTTTTTTNSQQQQQNQNHAGVLVECDLVQRAPRHLQSKMLKTVASKLALAARCDLNHLQHQGQKPGQQAQQDFGGGGGAAAAAGLAFRAQVEAKLQQWQEPDKAPVLKALPKPDLTVKKRRGGRKMRQLKERFEETALMKQANTRAFSAQTGEYGDDAMGLTMGLLDTAQQEGGGSGNVRKQVAEKRKMRQTNTKATRKRAAQMARYSSAATGAAASSATSGLASTISFTPMQAMELVNPDAQKDRVRQANLKWFSDSAGFQSAVPPKK